jgi:CRISPR/Cas system-associated endoribonuclease Cas2
MIALAKSDNATTFQQQQNSTFEGNLRANGQSKIEKTLQVPEVQELVACLSDVTERAGFEPAVG